MKRAKVHKLKLALSGERKIHKWEKKVLLKLKAFERAHLKQLVARSKHDKSKSIIMGLYTQLFQIVENSSHQLKSALRFKCQPLNSRTIRDYIYKICREPNDFTIIAFDFLVNMAENPSLKVVKSLKTLMSIYRGNGQSKQKSEGVTYTLDMVMDKLGISEKEYLGWKIKAHLRTDTQVNSDEECNSSRAQSPIVTAVLKNPSVVSSWPKHLKSPWNSSQLS
uniref:Uncharacterized protein n=2 Tax=Rhodnius prolixus TaxID=13249 RepID=T1HQG5_RHOPR